MHFLEHSGLGKDGEHNVCWKFGGNHTRDLIIRFFGYAYSEAGTFSRRQRNSEHLPPKGNSEDDYLLDTKGVFRHPTELRLLGLKSPEDKIVAGVANWCLKPVLTECAEVSPNGLAGRRQLAQNAGDVDYEGRKAAFSYQTTQDSYRLEMIS